MGQAAIPSPVQQPLAQPELWPEDLGLLSGEAEVASMILAIQLLTRQRKLVIYASTALGEIVFSVCISLISEWAHR